MVELTRNSLRQLQKCYRPGPFTSQKIPPTLSEVRIDSLLVHGDDLNVEDGVYSCSSSSPAEVNDDLYVDSTYANLSHAPLEAQLDGPSTPGFPQEHTDNLTTLHNTLQVHPDMAARVNQLIFDQEEYGAGLSRIFDPHNKSMLFLDRTVPLEPVTRPPQCNSLPLDSTKDNVLKEISESCLNSPILSSWNGKIHMDIPQKSRIPRPQSFNIPGTLKTSKSKVDLRFPKLEM